MSNHIFREKSLNKIKSPDRLDDYIRVTGPGLWLVIAAIIVLLCGFCVWGAAGTIEAKTTVGAAVLNGEATCQGNSAMIASLQKRLDDGEKPIFEMNGETGIITGVDEEKQLIFGEINTADGPGTATVFEKIKPMSLLFE